MSNGVSRGNDEFKAKYAPSPVGLLEQSLNYAYRIQSPQWRGDVTLVGVKLKLPEDGAGEVLVVLTGVDQEGAPVVAFHSAVGMLEALAGALRRMGTGSLKWRIDEYRAGRSYEGRD
jgi:hypothetical protein